MVSPPAARPPPFRNGYGALSSSRYTPVCAMFLVIGPRAPCFTNARRQHAPSTLTARSYCCGKVCERELKQYSDSEAILSSNPSVRNGMNWESNLISCFDSLTRNFPFPYIHIIGIDRELTRQEIGQQRLRCSHTNSKCIVLTLSGIQNCAPAHASYMYVYNCCSLNG